MPIFSRYNKITCTGVYVHVHTNIVSDLPHHGTFEVLLSTRLCYHSNKASPTYWSVCHRWVLPHHKIYSTNEDNIKKMFSLLGHKNKLGK